MNTRLGIITGAMFGGVMLAGAVVADPGLASPFSPGNFLHVGDREDDEHDENEDEDEDGGEDRQFNAQGATDSGFAGQQTSTDGRRHEEREHSRGPSSIVADAVGPGSRRQHEEDDD